MVNNSVVMAIHAVAATLSEFNSWIMQTTQQCDHCFFRQAKDAAAKAGVNEATLGTVVEEIQIVLQQLSYDVSPPVRASAVHQKIRELSGCCDPYYQDKKAATAHALSLYPSLKTLVSQSEYPLETAIRLAIAGNIIDLGVASSYDLEASIQRVLTEPLAIDHSQELMDALSKHQQVLYLADNAGECVLDRLLIEQLTNNKVTYVVKGSAAVNDATREDAMDAGIDQYCEIIDHGAATLGTLLDQCNDDFIQRFENAPLIIAKGMANYESLSATQRPIFFLLQAKCEVIADHIGVPLYGQMVMKEPNQ